MDLAAPAKGYFTTERHDSLREAVRRFAATEVAPRVPEMEATRAVQYELSRLIAEQGWIGVTIDPEYGGMGLGHLAKTIIIEELSRVCGAMGAMVQASQLGVAKIVHFGNDEQKKTWLPAIAAGKCLPTIAVTEPGSGGHVLGMASTAERDGDDYILSGEKTWISNGGIADVYVVFARTGEAAGAKGISAFIVPSDLPGFSVVERIAVIAPHPLARISFDHARIPVSAMIGAPGEGFKIAMATLDVFRTTVGAAALGFARRALDEATSRARERQLFGAPLADLQMVQASIADMALAVDAAALLVYRAAWTKDMGAQRVTREAAMAKLFATEQAQDVIDKAVQIHGGDGVRRGHIVERLYREIRALRIYEGASEVQKVIIARQTLSGG